MERQLRRFGWSTYRRVRPEGPPGLLMFYRPAVAPPATVLPEGYALRRWQPGDDAMWLDLLNANGEFGQWTPERLAKENRTLVSEGQFFIEHRGRIVATSGLYDRPVRRKPAWEVGWVAAHPEHRGIGLGRAVVSAVVTEAIARDRRPVFLFTDDFRLPAISIYLDLGFTPSLTSNRRYPRRWEAVYADIARYRGEHTRGPAGTR
jgi:mycothiol synthase